MLSLFSKMKNYGLKQSFVLGMFEFRRLIWNRLIMDSFSLDGEDLIIERLCGTSKTGFYVDVGACSPTRLSNTNHFYRKGWAGINVEANPDLIPEFAKHRPRDINVNCGAGLRDGENCDFYVMSTPTISTFSKDFLEMNKSRGHTHIKTEKIPIFSLATILDKHLPKGTEIDFLSIDVEGHDFDVLRGNDWERYRPKVIVVETITQYYPSPVPNVVFEQYRFLNERGYDLAYHNGIDSFYIRR